MRSVQNMAEELGLGKVFVSWAVEPEMKEGRILSETEIIVRVKKGDKEAYQVIVNRYMKRAYYIALGFVRNSQDALDISQEAFIRAFRKLKKFDTQRPFFPWFYQLIKNLCIDYLKRRGQRDEIPLNGVRIMRTEKEDREMKEVLWKGINSLTFEQKEVILLRYFQQCSYNEIADIMEIPVGTVMSSLYYAKKRLKKNVEKYLS
ncbi:MAG: RNA polymerase sigma factor [Candidatus Aminicenantaceae bacterium]